MVEERVRLCNEDPQVTYHVGQVRLPGRTPFEDVLSANWKKPQKLHVVIQVPRYFMAMLLDSLNQLRD